MISKKTVGEVAEFKNSLRKPVTASERKPGPYPYYGAATIQDWVHDYLFEGLHVLVGEDGTVQTPDGRPMIQLVNGRFWVNNHAHVLRCSSDLDTRYLAYSLREISITPFITGAAQPKVNMGNLKRIAITWPDKETRSKIASIGERLDHRITLLRETNTTLEAIAQALFKSWFVDFDPVRAKEEGSQPEHMDAATAALFPDSFEESEIGLVPRGWMTRPIYNMAAYVNGAAYKAFEPNSERRGLPIIKIAELKAGISAQTAFSDVAMPEKYLIETGDILFSWSGNPDTSIDIFIWHHAPALLNQHIFRVLPHEATERSFVLQMLRHLKPVFADLARNKQTTGLGHVTVADLKRLHVVHPPHPVIEQFNILAIPIHQNIFANEQQAQTLTQLRDTLLPKLISGEIRLPEAESIISDAVSA